MDSGNDHGYFNQDRSVQTDDHELSHIINNMWDWNNEEDFSLPNGVVHGISPSLWDQTVQNEAENPLGFHESTTPVRSCGDMPYHAKDNGNMSKVIQQSKEASSQGKKRRVLQFDDEPLQNPFRKEENPSVVIKSKERMWLDDAMVDMSQWVSGFADDASLSDLGALSQSSDDWLADYYNDTEIYNPNDTNLSGASNAQTDNSEFSYKPPEYEAPVVQVQRVPKSRQIVVSKDDASLSGHGALDQSSEGSLADCFNDTEIYNPNDTNLSGASDVQTDNSESSYKPPEYEAPVVQVQRAPRTRQIVVSKDTTWLQKLTNPASSVVYPFDFIKPSAANGDLTLEGINQMIRTPRKLREEYPTSAFSGKPVVRKTKIRIEGGKGTITVMRTKG